MRAAGDADAAPQALCRHSLNPSRGQRKEGVTLFLALGDGQRSTQGRLPLRRLKLRFPLELLRPLPVPAAAHPAPRRARTNGADELLKSFLRALFPKSRSQRPPVATCQSQGLITCARAGSGTFLPGLTLRDVDIRQVGPASPRPAARRGRRRGDATHELRGDRQRQRRENRK